MPPLHDTVPSGLQHPNVSLVHAPLSGMQLGSGPFSIHIFPPHLLIQFDSDSLQKSLSPQVEKSQVQQPFPGEMVGGAVVEEDVVDVVVVAAAVVVVVASVVEVVVVVVLVEVVEEEEELVVVLVLLLLGGETYPLLSAHVSGMSASNA